MDRFYKYTYQMQKNNICPYLLAYGCLVAQTCLSLCNLMDCSLPGFSVHGIFQAGILE